jgi:hypothetical protein
MSPARARWLRFGIAAAVVIAGLIVVLVTSGTASIVGWGVAGIGATLAISFGFLEIGLSEDRDRAAGRQ